MDDILGVLEVLGYFGAFWLFVLSPTYRHTVLTDWRARSLVGRGFGLLEGTIASVIGLAPIALLVWAVVLLRTGAA